MRRFVLVALAVMAAAFVAAIALIWRATAPDGAPAQPERPSPAAPAPEAPPLARLPQVDLTKVPLQGVALPPPVIVQDEPPPPPPPGSWEAVPILASRRGGNVVNFDDDVRARLSDCFTNGERRYAGSRPTEVKDAAPLREGSSTLLLLQLDVVRDEALVVDAPMESRGMATEATVACAQAVLRNARTPAGGLPAGRHRVRFLLTP